MAGLNVSKTRAKFLFIFKLNGMWPYWQFVFDYEPNREFQSVQNQKKIVSSIVLGWIWKEAIIEFFVVFIHWKKFSITRKNFPLNKYHSFFCKHFHPAYLGWTCQPHAKKSALNLSFNSTKFSLGLGTNQSEKCYLNSNFALFNKIQKLMYKYTYAY